MNPLPALATMKPVWPVVMSVTVVVKPADGSVMATLTTSPGLILSVCAFGVSVARLDSCGPGGPVGTPLVCSQAKFCGSSQFGLMSTKLNLDSRLSIVIAPHHCVLLQLSLSTNGAKPGA